METGVSWKDIPTLLCLGVIGIGFIGMLIRLGGRYYSDRSGGKTLYSGRKDVDLDQYHKQNQSLKD